MTDSEPRRIERITMRYGDGPYYYYGLLIAVRGQNEGIAIACKDAGSPRERAEIEKTIAGDLDKRTENDDFLTYGCLYHIVKSNTERYIVKRPPVSNIPGDFTILESCEATAE